MYTIYTYIYIYTYSIRHIHTHMAGLGNLKLVPLGERLDVLHDGGLRDKGVVGRLGSAPA